MQIMKYAQGIKVLGISSKRIAEIEVEIPCIEEQSKIVDFLMSLDNKINFNNSTLKEIDLYKENLLNN